MEQFKKHKKIWILLSISIFIFNRTTAYYIRFNGSNEYVGNGDGY